MKATRVHSANALSQRHAALVLGVHRNTIRSWLQTGRLSECSLTGLRTFLAPFSRAWKP